MASVSVNFGVLTRHVRSRLVFSVLRRTAPSSFQQGPCVIATFYSHQNYLSTIDGPICDIYSSDQRQTHLTNWAQKRFRRRKDKGSKAAEDEEEDDDDDDEVLAGENPLLVDDLLGAANDGSQEITIDVNSLRLDSVCKTGFALTRGKVEETFYSGDIYINGERASKKSQDLSLNDEVDIIRSPDQDDRNLVHVKRLIITGLPDKANEQGRLKLKIKRWMDLTVESPSERGRD